MTADGATADLGRCLVTGAAGALGRAVVEHFSDNGATIAQLDVVGIENSHYAAI